ncbi:WD40 repeat-like protein [Suillus brevipes Sb2]|nr:WD40 repeat-like protein [Suillus brevipes Sb2]
MPAITPRQTMRGHTSWVTGVAHLPDGRRIITCSTDGSLRLWDLKSGTQIGENWRDDEPGVWSMALSPNGEIVASGCDDEKARLWDVETRKVIATWTGHRNVVRALCWSADGGRVASGSWDGTARVWDVKRGKNILTIKTGHKWVCAVTYSPDSSKLATGGNEENAVKIWDAKTGELLNTLKHDHMVDSLAWTSDGKKLISGSYRLIRIFDTATWQQIGVLEGHTNVVNGISLSSNNRFLASASRDGTARLWNLDTNLPVGPPLRHENDLDSAALSPDGKVLATGCENHNAYTWDVHAILKEAGLEDLLLVGPNIAPKDTQKQLAPQATQRTPRSSLSEKSFLEADATQCPGQHGSVDELPPAFFAGMEADVDSSPVGGSHHYPSVNALLTRLSSLLHRFRPDNGESTELPQPSRPSALHMRALLARLSSLIHSSPSENDAPDELQQPSTPSRVDPRVLLARLSLFLHRPQLNTDEEAEPHPTTPLSSRSDALISRLTSLFRSQPHVNEEIELTQRRSRPRVVDVAAVRDRQALVVARGPQFEKAKRAYEQARLHAQTQASSSHTQPADASTSTTHPAPVTTASQPSHISWWAQIVLFLCCFDPQHVNGH